MAHQTEGKVAFLSNLGKAQSLGEIEMKQVFYRLRAKQGSRSGLDSKIHPGSCCLGNYSYPRYGLSCLETSYLIRCSGLAFEAASLCQSDLDPPNKSGMFLLVQFQTIKFLLADDFVGQIFSMSKKAVLTQRRESEQFTMALSLLAQSDEE